MDLNKLKEIQAVVFDMDGLMFDSERYVQKSWDIAGERLGYGPLGHNIANTLGTNLTNRKKYFLEHYGNDFPFDEYDYVVDAVDTVTAKIEIIMQAQKHGTQVISSMGAGNKLDPAAFQVADIYKTKMCPLAKVMRRELKKRGVKKLKVVYSEEKPTRPIEDMSISCRTNCICPPGAEHKCTERRDIPGSVAFVPSVAGLIIAGEVVKDIAGK